ncbi:cytochrome p450 [Diplodia corticola]|uniref:Cytochrome p450 n=1 Tax=Diplodia corticola TaxID=236234 RepID=A0A1J9R4Q1_9PEZI|nr:cytochrome p450 [Diplodia corticola]OJD35576.1 cytochrome p450 [Diplodia corticola]
MLTPTALVASAIPLYLLWSALSLYTNVRRAKATGLRVHVSPISTHNLLWIVFEPLVVRLLEFLGADTVDLLRLAKRNWNFHDRYRVHDLYGKVFAHATPAGIEVHVADAAASDELLARKRDFIKPMGMVQIIDIYGPSVASTDGADWTRHRRITATPFTERNNRLVWAEALRQTGQMLAYFERGIGPNGPSTDSFAQDSMTLTLNILTSAGLGFSCDFRGAEEEKDADTATAAATSYRDSLAGVLDSFLHMALVPGFVWSLPPALLPTKLQDFARHKNALKHFMVGMAEKTRYEGSEHASLLSNLVQKNEEARQTASKPSSSGNPVQLGLSDSELYGNIFIYSFAGHETTAHAVCYAMYLLAAYPDVQDWVAEEAQAVLGTDAALEHLAYDELFPQLKRTLAVMYETLRLYPPVVSIPKTTGPSAQTLTVNANTPGQLTATLPAHTYVFPNVVALQSHPDYWGPDSLTWRPQRWISENQDAQDASEAETFRQPAVKGSFVSWSDGPRVCPGKKFSQVESVAVMAGMLREHRVEVVPEGGEGEEKARQRVLDVVEDGELKATLFMRRPEAVRLRVVKR